MRSRSHRKTFALHELKHRLRTTASEAGSQANPEPPQAAAAPAPAPAPAKKPKVRLTNKQKRRLSPTERQLFRQAMSNVQPIKSTGRRVLAPKPGPLARATPQQFKERQAHAQNHTDALLDARLSDDYYAGTSDDYLQDYLNPRCGTDVLRDLKRGRWPLQASIDLHGATLEHARLRLERFLQHALAEEFRCLRIVHGKGYGSADKRPVLLHQIRRWLTQLDVVLAFSDCPPNEGGNGAVKVLLRKPRTHR